MWDPGLCGYVSEDSQLGLVIQLCPCMQEHLLALHKKLEFAKSSEMASNAAAMQDIAPELERLRAKAVTKSRDILMNRCACCQAAFRCPYQLLLIFVGPCYEPSCS